MKKKSCIFLFLFCLVKLAGAQSSLTQQYQQKMGQLLGVSTPEDEAPSAVAKVIDFAKSLIGVPYRYASGNPERGFDCSGFVSYVFQNCGFKVPRSSVEFSHAGKATTLAQAKIGDVLIFTGSNPKVRKIGHVGIIYSIDNDGIKFIHSTSGKANGVTVTELNAYYKSRFLKVVSILE